MKLPPLAILDWGIGGAGVAAALLRDRPDASFVYISDSGFTPYGKVPSAKLRQRVTAIAHWLEARGVRDLAIACNAASTVSRHVRRDTGLNVVDIIEHGIHSVERAHVDYVGVIGGLRTIRSGIFKKRLGVSKVVQRVGQPLSALVERGILEGPKVDRALIDVIAPLRDAEALLLACTHYPALLPSIRNVMPASVRLLDPAQSMAAELAGTVVAGKRVALTTGDAVATRRGARLAFGVDLGAVRAFRVG